MSYVVLPQIVPPTALEVREWQGQRVVTLADIDRLHRRPEGTARRNFNEHRERFIAGEDYFTVSRSELRTNFVGNSEGNPNIEMILITESGYLMITKSLTDDLAWQIQRGLVNTYFRERMREAPKSTPKPTTLKYLAEVLRATTRGLPPQTDAWPVMRAAYQAAGIDVPETLEHSILPAKAAYPAAPRASTTVATDLDSLRATLQAALQTVADRIIGWRSPGPWINGQHIGMLKTMDGRQYLVCEPTWVVTVLQSPDARASKRAMRAAGWLRTDKGHAFSCNVLLRARGQVRPMMWIDLAAAGLACDDLTPRRDGNHA
ncbi:ORF6N domain-containing protein [Sulfobacillus sp. hq2]|uniref:ORF6N domain-containing protein n=1 Tax=Sulfobacillus TaxID=28033 RepID=UPI000CD323A5|nr:ORF6N domain-containing protein [Sulfobacillus sp. hq2]POB10129.1 hypothetical protein CO251_11635 [Sulfobacillus sp. hq2]